jgi:hypothetical protein
MCKGWVVRGCSHLLAGRAGVGHMWHINADMGLDWMDICFRARHNRSSKPFLLLYSFSLSLYLLLIVINGKIDLTVVCILKINHVKDVNCAFILGLLARISS